MPAAATPENAISITIEKIIVLFDVVDAGAVSPVLGDLLALFVLFVPFVLFELSGCTEAAVSIVNVVSAAPSVKSTRYV